MSREAALKAWDTRGRKHGGRRTVQNAFRPTFKNAGRGGKQGSLKRFRQRVGNHYARQMELRRLSMTGSLGRTTTNKRVLSAARRYYGGGSVRVPNHWGGGVTYAPRGGAALQIWQRRQWGD